MSFFTTIGKALGLIPEEDSREQHSSMKEIEAVEDTKPISLRALVFDTETTGLKSGYNVILQLTYQIVNTADWSIEKEVNHFFPWPEDRDRVSYEAIMVNGLSEEFLAGQQLSDKREALAEFIRDLKGCDLAVAHNLSFDKRFIEADCQEEGVIENPGDIEWPTYVDTMKDTTDFCQLLPMRRGEYKWPKLSELASKLSISTRGLRLHDSRSDVEITKRCFRELCNIGFYNLSLVESSSTEEEENEQETPVVADYLDEIEKELATLEKNISSEKACLKAFTMPVVNDLKNNMVYLDFGNDPEIEKAKDVLNYVSPEAYAYIKKKEGLCEMKYTLQNMKDRVEAVLNELEGYTASAYSLPTPVKVTQHSTRCMSVMQKSIECVETLVNNRLMTFYGEPGVPSDYIGLYAVGDLYSRLTSTMFRLYKELASTVSPDKYSKKMYEILAKMAYGLYCQAKDIPGDTLQKVLDFESDPNSGNHLTISPEFNIDTKLSAQMTDTLVKYGEYVSANSR